MSETDRTFLTEVFLNQVSTLSTCRAVRALDPDQLACSCLAEAHGKPLAAEVEFSVAFSLVVNRKREHSICAAERIWCPVCGRSEDSLAPAALIRPTARPLTRRERVRMQVGLKAEIKAKVVFEGEPDSGSVEDGHKPLAAGSYR